jgi:hypothetical protein
LLASLLLLGMGIVVTLAQGALAKTTEEPARAMITLAGIVPTAIIGGASVFGMPVGLGVMGGALALVVLLGFFQPSRVAEA